MLVRIGYSDFQLEFIPYCGGVVKAFLRINIISYVKFICIFLSILMLNISLLRSLFSLRDAFVSLFRLWIILSFLFFYAFLASVKMSLIFCFFGAVFLFVISFSAFSFSFFISFEIKLFKKGVYASL